MFLDGSVVSFCNTGLIFRYLYLNTVVFIILARKPFRGPQSKFLAGVGLVAGISYACTGSLQRFLGLEANPYEVQRYGVMSADEVARRTEQMNTPNLVLIDSSANHED